MFQMSIHTFFFEYILARCCTYTNPADDVYEVNLGRGMNNESVANGSNFSHVAFGLGAPHLESHLWAPHPNGVLIVVL